MKRSALNKDGASSSLSHFMNITNYINRFFKIKIVVEKLTVNGIINQVIKMDVKIKKSFIVASRVLYRSKKGICQFYGRLTNKQNMLIK